jgi:hypothetical protein
MTVKTWSNCAAMLLASVAWTACAGAPVPTNGGPYNASFLPGGIGIERPVDSATVTAEGAAYTMSAWVKSDARQAGDTALIALGGRALSLVDGRLTLRDGQASVRGAAIAPARWTHVAAVSDGASVTLYVDGKPVAHGGARASATGPTLAIAPAIAGRPHFGGTLVGATLHDSALSTEDVAREAAARPDFATVQLWQVGVGSRNRPISA